MVEEISHSADTGGLCAWAGRVSTGTGAYYPITRVHTMPLSSKTIARVAPQTAHPLTVTPRLRPMPRLSVCAGRVVNGALILPRFELGLPLHRVGAGRVEVPSNGVPSIPPITRGLQSAPFGSGLVQ